MGEGGWGTQVGQALTEKKKGVAQSRHGDGYKD